MKTIPLTQGLEAKVDDHWFGRLSAMRWQAARDKKNGLYYAVHARRGQKNLIMHRVITGAVKDVMVDHANQDALDNRECNLRICTNGQNQANQKIKTGGTSKFKGVSWAKAMKKWYAGIKYQGHSYSLGHFNDEVEAAKAYDDAAVSLRGSFACTNF